MIIFWVKYWVILRLIVEYNATFTGKQTPVVTRTNPQGCSDGPPSGNPPPQCSSFQSPYFFEYHIVRFHHPERCRYFYESTTNRTQASMVDIGTYLGCMGCYNGLNCVCT